jgi:hypothetical protein
MLARTVVPSCSGIAAPRSAARHHARLGEVVLTTYSYGSNPDLDEFAPENLARPLCDHDCVVVAEYTPIEPDVFELK